MTHYTSNTTLDAIVERIRSSRRVLITTHVKPDGDAMGSVLALKRGLAQLNIQSEIFLSGPLEHSLRILAEPTPYHLLEQTAPDDEFDLTIVVDTGSWTQLEPIEHWLRRHHKDIIGFDHHWQGDDVAAMRIVDSHAVSTTAMLVPLFRALNVQITGGAGGIAEALFTGLATDSGWFRFGNAGADAFDLAAKLLRCGADKSRLYQIIEETYSPQRLVLQGKALASLEYVRNGSVAIQSLGIDDFKQSGGAAEDLTGLVNAPMSVAQVRVSILLSQHSPGLTKVSFRSKPPLPGADADDFVDVNVLANKFGGGGHVHAAGAKLKLDLVQAKARVVAVLD